jgi:hypothetical protein
MSEAIAKYLPEGLTLLCSRGFSEKQLSRPENNDRVVVAHGSPDYHVAFPGLCVTADGELFCVFRQGLTHAADTGGDARLVAMKSSDEGASWTEPWVIQDDPEYDDRNSGAETGPDGRIAVCWDKYLPVPGVERHFGAYLALSDDGGKTFGPAITLGHIENVHTRSRPLWVDDSHIIVPISKSTGDPDAASYVVHVDLDSGDQEMVAISPPGDRGPADETAITRNADGRLVALIRDCEIPWLWQTESDDGGYTWADLHISAIPSQSTPCDLIRIDDGALICSFSFRQRRNERLAISRDGGATWDVENSVDVFAATPEVVDRSYPATVEMPSGNLGTAIYETSAYPDGGRIYFITNTMAQFSAPREACLYADGTSEAAFVEMSVPEGPDWTLAARYRFTGRFGVRPHKIGWRIIAGDNSLDLNYFMGMSRKRWDDMAQGTETLLHRDGETALIRRQSVETIYCDGREHELKLVGKRSEYALTLDGEVLAQMRLPEAAEKIQLRIEKAAVAVYDLETQLS